MLQVTVHPTIGAEAEKVKRPIVGDQGVRQGVEGRVASQASVAYGLGDPNQFLSDDATRTDGEMPHL
jgi:hypothetical protein